MIKVVDNNGDTHMISSAMRLPGSRNLVVGNTTDEVPDGSYNITVFLIALNGSHIETGISQLVVIYNSSKSSELSDRLYTCMYCFNV